MKEKLKERNFVIIGIVTVFVIIVAFLTLKLQNKKVLDGEWVNIYENKVTTGISGNSKMKISGNKYSIKGEKNNIDVYGEIKIEPKDKMTGSITFNHSEKTSDVGTYVNVGNYYLSGDGNILQINLTGTENYDTWTTTIGNSLMSPKVNYEYMFVKKGSRAYLNMKKNEEKIARRTSKLKRDVQGTWIIKNKSEIESKIEDGDIHSYVSKIKVSGSRAIVTLVDKDYRPKIEQPEEKATVKKYSGHVSYYESGFNIEATNGDFSVLGFEYVNGNLRSDYMNMVRE